MLIETIAAIFLLVCLMFFFSVNLHNIIIVHKQRGCVRIYAEVDRPSGFIVSIAAFGTLVYFLEALTYLILAFSGLIFLVYYSPFHFQFLLTYYIQALGLALTILGYCLFIWSVLARGKYSTSWGMPENQRLVTWGPYRFVRHPSYLGYFLMFFGLFFLWPNLFTVFPLFAIPGYFQIAFEEEKLLMQRFGDEYLEYQKRTGRFVPKFR